MSNLENIRNFCIIAHIDHGKSTLADRFLEITETIPEGKMRPQYLDMMDLEREKGITIKMKPVRMDYVFNNKPYILNLIDTPGHVDFSYEVSRSLAAVEGTILLVDAAKGIQAQTIANLELARRQGLVIIPVINKIDLPQAKIEETKEEIVKIFNIAPEEIILVSGKTGENVESLLNAMVEKVPPPTGKVEGPFRALIFDSEYDSHRGVISFIRVVDGEIRKGDKIHLLSNDVDGEVLEIGYFKPEMTKAEVLKTGEAGYLATGVKEPGRVKVGDTITKLEDFKAKETSLLPLPGYQEPRSVVFASFYPEDPNEFELLRDALTRLKLSDASLFFEPETKEMLGRGFRCGFLGLLHTEITTERLSREFGLNLIISSPSVLYKIINKKKEEKSIFTASDWPEQFQIEEAREPWTILKITTPIIYIGQVFEVLSKLSGSHIETKHLSQEKVLISYNLPLREVITNLYENIKNVTSGFASTDYQISEYRISELAKLDILIAGKKIEAFAKIVPESIAHQEGKKMVQKLKQTMPRQQFSVPLQAVVGAKIIARETLSAKGKDVLAPLYGGDYTRKLKLLQRQKKGKAELKEKGQLHIPQKVFLDMLKS
ncbi:translation elongation factor 4 [Candidatus Parcubacteria bacterium]|nr:translation elongation factor 4 [Patescibacteria group bacterium]MBU4466826.1 translation elongation factor 4 [Patescibacteria group bacterium]MCG2688530.1 translation elongation factor 4 [Candidatus Parcubacteria bacterium]